MDALKLASLFLIFTIATACGPVANNELQVKAPSDYPDKARYTSPNGIDDREINEVTPGTKAGPPELLINGQRILFPVKGKYKFADDFGSPRIGHLHEGNDILAQKMVPVIAVADGVVQWVHGPGNDCCAIAIGHSSGWNTRYFHLNNDKNPKSDDGKGNGIAPGLKEKSRVHAGQVIGWVGDSGNAEKGSPHLHFEIRYYERPINPYQALIAARHLGPSSKSQLD